MHPTRCFVLMPFLPALDSVYGAIRVALKNAGCECIRADEISRSVRITDDIYEQITTARFLIADVTGMNPNVYYELGLAHALDKDVIVLLQAGYSIPFDINGIRYLRYSVSNLDEFSKNLMQYIKETLKTIPKQWLTETTEKGPNIRISGIDYPARAVMNGPLPVRVLARNFGQEAKTGYFSLSFPFGVADIKVIRSDGPNVRVGRSGEHWKSKHVILSYPIAEAYTHAGNPVWPRMVTYSLDVEVVPTRLGFLHFYAAASTFSDDHRHILDPPDAALLDQRDEPVYCGIVEVV